MEKISHYSKMGIRAIVPFKKNNKWVFKKDNFVYDIAPAEITEVSLNPLVSGIDKIISFVCKEKDIKENSCLLLFSENYFPNADAKFDFVELKYNGWIYNVEGLNLTGFLTGQRAWFCSYMTLYFDPPPKNIYVRLENYES